MKLEMHIQLSSTSRASLQAPLGNMALLTGRLLSIFYGAMIRRLVAYSTAVIPKLGYRCRRYGLKYTLNSHISIPFTSCCFPYHYMLKSLNVKIG